MNVLRRLLIITLSLFFILQGSNAVVSDLLYKNNSISCSNAFSPNPDISGIEGLLYSGGIGSDINNNILNNHERLSQELASMFNSYTAMVLASILDGIETSNLIYYKGAGKITVTSSIIVSDADNGNLQSAEIKISTGNIEDEDELSFEAGNGITSSWDPANGILTLNGESLVENYQTALRSVQYENTNTINPITGPRTISFIVSDGNDNSNTVSRDIIIQVNIPPVLANIESGDLSYNEGSKPAPVTDEITISDEDDTTLESAKVIITSGYVNGEDVLSFKNVGGISGTWDASTATMSLSGNAKIANYRAALRKVEYENTNTSNPTGTRVISFLVNDGDDNSNTATRNISIAGVNAPPVLASIEGSALSYNEGAGPVSITDVITITDADDANLVSATVSISSGYVNGEDVLSFANAGGITGTWDAATGTLSLSGNTTIANYQSELRNVFYENMDVTNPTLETRTVSFFVNDITNSSNTLTRNITIANVNQTPVLSAIETETFNYNEGEGKKNVTSSITIEDADNDNLQSAVITIASGYKNGEDVLSFTDANGITGSWNAGQGRLSFSGEASVANYQAALRSVQYENTNATNPSNELRTISFITNDDIDSSNTLTRIISINHINKAPVLANIEGSNLVYNIGVDPVNITNNIIVTDIDDGNLSSATIQIVNGYFQNEDILSFLSSDNISAIWNVVSGTLSLTGTSSFTNYQKALRNIKYLNSNNLNPSITVREISFTVNDGEINSNSLQRTLNLNSPPTATNLDVEGILSVCQTITGNYFYSDVEGDEESYSTFRWLSAEQPDGIKTPISGATTNSYIITAEDQDKYLFFEVTPQAKNGSIQGNVVLSNSTSKIINNLPTATLSGPTAVCEGETANLQVSFTGTPPFHYVYTDGNSNQELNTSEMTQNIPVLNSGTFKGLSLTDNLGCEVNNLASIVTIETEASPLAQILDLNNAYSLRSLPVALKGSPNGGIFSGKGVITTDNTFSAALAGVEGSPHPVVYKYADPASECMGYDTVFVEIIDADAAITSTRPQFQFCNIDIPTLITGTNIAGSIGTFIISGGVGLTDHKNNTATLDPNKLIPGNYTISYSYKQNNITQTIYQNININLVDNVIISGFKKSSYCKSEPALSITSNYPSGTFSGNGISENSGSYFFSPRNAKTGGNEVSFKYVNSYGCVLTDTLIVNALSTTKPEFDINTTCWNNSATPFLNLTSHPDSVKAWKWIFGDASASPTDNQSALKTPSHKYSGPGDYSIQLITNNLNNCSDTLTKAIHLGNKPTANFAWEKECTNRNESLHINNTTSSEDEIESYSWTILNPSGTSQKFSTNDITNLFEWDKKYKISLVINTIYGCKDSISKYLYPGPAYSLKDSSYTEDFEKITSSWNIEEISNNNWSWQIPSGGINTAHSGNKAIITKYGFPKVPQQFILSSPCFDFTGVNRPYFELWINSTGILNEEGTVLQYKIENSQSWVTTGNLGTGINWYNSETIASKPAGGNVGWSGSINGWKKSVNALDALGNKKNVKLRLVYGSKTDGSSSNIFALDDISIGIRQKTSLFENFTNLSSNSALTFSNQLNLVLNEAGNDVVGIEYHASFPGSDSLNVNNPADPGARILYYGVGLIPYGFLNGGTQPYLNFDFITKKPTPADIIAQSLGSAPYLLSTISAKTDDNINGKVIITSQGNYTNQRISLYTVIVEDILVQSDNGTITLYNVVKKFLPSAGGTPIQANWTKGEQIEVPFNWKFVKVYDPDKIEVVAFLQADETKEVLQAVSSKQIITSTQPKIDGKETGIKEAVLAPNPATEISRIIFPAPLKKDLKLEIFNLNGQMVKSDKIFKTVDVYEFNVSDFNNGLYFIRLLETNGNVKILKLTVNH